MKLALRWYRTFAMLPAAVLISAGLFCAPALAGTTGTITGTVTDAQSNAPLANVKVSAASPSGNASTVTNAQGFYALQTLIPDTYTVSFQAEGYEPRSEPGITIQQDLAYKLDRTLSKQLKEIAKVQTRSAGNLVKAYTGTDVYNISGQQLNAATGGDSLHKTIYEYLDTVPGVTPIGGGFPAEPSIRGGYDVDNGYELDGIPITERITGFFTTNLTDLGISNVEVYTGGLSAQNAGNGVGIINSVIKSGTFPAFGSASLGVTSPDFNHSARFEYGGTTPNRRFTYYFGVDAINSQNDINYGTDAFNILQLGISSGNPGYIYTRDAIANFHYKPNPHNDFQFLYQNSLFNSGVNYALYSGTSSAPLLALEPCTGAVASNDTLDGQGNVLISGTSTGGMGGTAPNGQTCPGGLYFKALTNGAGNFLGHYSGIGKVQWNHIINDHSSFALRFAENFNQYIFDQKLTDPNDPQNGSAGPGCPNYPYAAGSPLPLSTDGGFECTFDLGDYYQNRSGNNYYGSLDYTSTPNENLTLQAGIGTEYDHQIRDVRYLNLFNNPNNSNVFGTCEGGSFSYSCRNSYTDIPTHVPFAYVQATINHGKFTFEPGLRYQQITYSVPNQPGYTPTGYPNGVPGGNFKASFLAPSLLGTYRFNAENVARFSYSTTAQFIGTEFVYRLESKTYNPTINGKNAYEPQLNRSYDLQFEHQFDPSTSLKVGPYFRTSDNYLAQYAPLIALSPGGAPKYGPLQVSNNLKIRDFGIEFGLSHENRSNTGISYWFSGSYNNYWTQITDFGQVAFINFPVAQYFLNQGIFVRSALVPPFGGTLVADIHSHGTHFIPDIYYTFGNFYNLGGCEARDPNTGAVLPYNQYSQQVGCKSNAATFNKTLNPVLAPEAQGMGYWKVNVSLLKELNPHYTVGIHVTNLTENEHDLASSTTPCYNYPSLPDGSGTGCYSYTGARSGTVAAPGYIYQNLTTDPRRIEFFLNYKF